MGKKPKGYAFVTQGGVVGDLPRPYQSAHDAKEEADAATPVTAAPEMQERPSGGWGDVLVEDPVAHDSDTEEGLTDAELNQAARTYGEGV